MNQRPLLLLIYAATSALAFAQEKPAGEPPQLVTCREEHLRAVQRAMAPVLQNYVTKLTGLKQQFAREGKFEAGVAVENELREATRQLQAAQGAADPTKPISAQLTIVSAVYGDSSGKRTANVERALRQAMAAGRDTIPLTNEGLNGGGDPAPMAPKRVTITYTIGGVKKEKTFGEKTVLDFKNDLK